MSRKNKMESAAPLPVEDLPDVEGDVESVFAEMEAQRAFFDAALKRVPVENVTNLASYALHIRGEDRSLEDRLTTFCLAYSVGELRLELIPHRWSRSTRWSRRTTEDLITAWMRWVAWEDWGSVVVSLEKMEKGRDDTSIEALPIQYWATAIHSLAKKEQDTARRYFERAMEVSSQFGFPSNPPICWTYAVSFLPS